MGFTWKANFRLMGYGDVCDRTANSLNPLCLAVFLHHMHKWSDHIWCWAWHIEPLCIFARH